MTDAERREAARQFINKWNGKGKEDEDARSYWIDILVNVLGMDHVTDRVQFEKKVAGDKSKKRIDVYIPETNVLIEQKSLGIDLDKPQSVMMEKRHMSRLKNTIIFFHMMRERDGLSHPILPRSGSMTCRL